MMNEQWINMDDGGASLVTALQARSLTGTHPFGLKPLLTSQPLLNPQPLYSVENGGVSMVALLPERLPKTSISTSHTMLNVFRSTIL